MTQKEIKKLYHSKIGKIKNFKFLNAFIVFIFAFLFFFVGEHLETENWSDKNYNYQEKKEKLFYQGFRINIKKQLPKEMENEIAEKLEKDKSNKKSIKKTSKKLRKKGILKKKNSPTKLKLKPELKENLFKENVFTFKVPNEKNIYRFTAIIDNFPTLKNFSGGIALEFYNAKKEYLFTYYTKHFWHEDGYETWQESGYDDGEYWSESGTDYWNEKNINDTIRLQFPKKEKIHILVGLPNSKNKKQLYDIFKEHSKGSISLWIQEISTKKQIKKRRLFLLGDKDLYIPLFIIALIISLFLLKRAAKTGVVLPGKLLTYPPDFTKYHYITKVHCDANKFFQTKEIKADQFFYVTGYSKETRSHNTMELIVNNNNENYYIEIEREKEEGVVNFYYYLYQSINEKQFSQVPTDSQFHFRGTKMVVYGNGLKKKNIQFVYENGLKEKKTKKMIDYRPSFAKENYLSFEYEENSADFEVSFGKEARKLKIWRIKK